MKIEIAASPRHFLGMPAAAFLRDYWQKRPLLVRQAFPGFEAPLAPEDLAGLACEQGPLSRLVIHHRRTDRYELRTGPFAESLFPTLGRKDWTLLVQDMDKWDLDVRALLARFDFLPRWRVDDIMISFAAPGGSVGPHVDQYDVFLLQAQGRRRWQIDSAADAPREFRADAELKLLREFDPTHDWVLEPGDMLYLPPGVPHHGEAVDACMTFSVGMRAPSRAELLGAWSDHLLEQLPEELRYADPDLRPATAAGEIDDAAADRLLAIFEEHRPTSRAQAADFLARFASEYRNAQRIAPPPKPPPPARIEATLEAGGCLRPHPFARLFWRRQGREAVLYVQGEAFGCSRKAAQLLCSDQPLAAGEVATLDEPGRWLLQELARRGYFVLERTGRRPR